MQSALPGASTVTRASGLTSTSSTSPAVTLANPGNPLSLHTETMAYTLNRQYRIARPAARTAGSS